MLSSNLKNQKGFTLIELMIVVAIIGILSAIAIPNFLAFRMKAKASEAKSNLGSIRTCEEAYKTEHEVYLDVTDWPVAAPTPVSVPWGVGSTFEPIGFAPSGNVFYQYKVVVVQATEATDFVATALGNLDGIGNTATYTLTQTNDITSPPAGDY